MSIIGEIHLSDDDLRAALFDALLERLGARAGEDASIAVVNRMPTVFAVSRLGNLLTVSQGIGLQLLRVDLKSKDRHEGLRSFTVSRATVHPRLVITPDRVEGTPDEILDWIVAKFLAWTVAEKAARRAAAEPVRQESMTPAVVVRAAQEPQSEPGSLGQESRPTAPAPQNSPPLGEAEERRSAPVLPAEEPRPPDTPTLAETAPEPDGITRLAAADIAREDRPASLPAVKRDDAEAVPARAAAIRELTPPLRTYQLLLETAQRELEYAKVLPAGSRYFLISAGVFVGLTAEAFINDLGSRVIPSWRQLPRLDPREKAEVLNIELFNANVDWSSPPFKSVAAALGFRRALAHAHAETLSVELVPADARRDNEVPRTRRTVWQEHCNVPTIDQWISDIRVLIEQFSRAHEAG